MRYGKLKTSVLKQMRDKKSKISPLEIRIDDGKILMIFRESTKWVRFSPEMAETIGHRLIEFSIASRGHIILPPSGVTVQ